MSEEPPVDRRKLSPVPSWVMVGFLLGVLATLGFCSERAPRTEVPAPKPEERDDPATARNALALPDQPSLTVVEALFEQYRDYVFWENDRTEIAVWNTRTLGFTDLFEVLRTNTGTYFRTIPELTRLPLEGYGPPDSPIKFTETAAQRAARLQKDRSAPPRPAPPPPVDLPRVAPPPRGTR